ncbi:putative holin-like toxin [Novosphingobium sp.]|nr:putative holin-like toxin [Novosphingobium sp.]
MSIKDAVMLVIGVATFLVAFVGLVVKLIELGRR